MIVNLPWYDYPGQETELDRFWLLLRRELQLIVDMELPVALDRDTDFQDQWINPQLLLSQCCGPDLYEAQNRELVAIGRPVFGKLGCSEGNYFSYIVASKKLPRSPVVGVNALTSNSGCTALLAWLDRQEITPAAIVLTDSHEASLQAIRDQVVDVAAIDANSWSLLDHAEVTIIDYSEEMPAPPFVQSRFSPIPPIDMFAGISGTLNKMPVVGMTGMTPVSKEIYKDLSLHRSELVGKFLDDKRKAGWSGQLASISGPTMPIPNRG